MALLAIAGGLAAYFNAYPTIKFVNKTIINTIHVEETSNFGKNPAPGTCLPIIVKFCQGQQIPYNYTVFPNYIGHFGQLETQVVRESDTFKNYINNLQLFLSTGSGCIRSSCRC